jgi:hypothetical protein
MVSYAARRLTDMQNGWISAHFAINCPLIGAAI